MGLNLTTIYEGVKGVMYIIPKNITGIRIVTAIVMTGIEKMSIEPIFIFTPS